jgi:hypothetical protein
MLSSALALGTICSHVLKCILAIFKILKILEQKICTYIFTCYESTKSFPKKSTFHVACVKKNSVLIIRIFDKKYFLFFR